MRVVIRFSVLDASPVPWHYNELLQAMIYHSLGPEQARFWHNQGFSIQGRRMKLFVFSRLFGPFTKTREGLRFHNTVVWYVASPSEAFLEALVLGLLRHGVVHLGNARFEVAEIGVLPPPKLRPPLHLRALSPITVYSTLETPEGRKKTYYYAPQEPEFGRLVLENLRRKIRAWSGEDIPPDGATFRPVKVRNRNLVVARYKGTIIKGWTGLYELDAPEPYLRMALDAGLGAKNSQGFGFVEVWEKKSHRDTENTEEGK